MPLLGAFKKNPKLRDIATKKAKIFFREKKYFFVTRDYDYCTLCVRFVHTTCTYMCARVQVHVCVVHILDVYVCVGLRNYSTTL
jgi:hypothetical protein